MNEENPNYTKWLNSVIRQATHKAYLRHAHSDHGAVILKDNDIVRVKIVKGKKKVEILKEGLEPAIKIKKGTKLKLEHYPIIGTYAKETE